MKTYTVKELADKFSVTEMAIHKQLKHDKLKEFVVYENNRKFLTEKGLQALTALRNSNQKYSSKSKEKDDINNNLNTIKETKNTSASTTSQTYSYFSDSTADGSESILYKQLCKQLEIKDSQIADLTSLLGKQTEQVNLLTHTIGNLNGTLQLKEVSNITSDINDISDINIKDIEADIMNKFGSAYKTTYTSSYENVVQNVAASDVEVSTDLDDVLLKAQQKGQQDIQNIISHNTSVDKEVTSSIVDAVITDDVNLDNAINHEGDSESSEIIFSAKEKTEEPASKPEPPKKGFWGKLFSKN